MKKELVGAFEIILSALIFSFTGILSKWGASFGTGALAFSRVFIAAISLFLFILISRKIKLQFIKKEWKRVLLFGALHAAAILLTVYSVINAPVSIVALLGGTYIFWFVIFSKLILNEKIHAITLFAAGVSFIGAVVILYPNLVIGSNIPGILAAVVTGIFAGLIYVLSKTIKSYDRVTLTFWQNLIAVPLLLPLIFIFPPNFTTSNITIALLLGSLFTALPFVLMLRGVEKLKGQFGGILNNTGTVFSVIAAMLFLGETLSFYTIIGGLFVILGSLLVVLKVK